MSCGVGHRRSSDLALMWLWHTLAAVALIRPPSLKTSTWFWCGPKKAKKKEGGERGMDKEDVVNIHNEILLNHKKEIMPLQQCGWMDLEIVIREISQRKTNTI